MHLPAKVNPWKQVPWCETMGKNVSHRIISGRNWRRFRCMEDRIWLISISRTRILSFLVGNVADGNMSGVFFTKSWCRFDLSKLVDYRLLAEAGESSRCYVYLCAFDWPAGVHFIDCVDVCGLVTHRRALLLEISNAFGSLWNNRSVPFFHGARDSFTKRIFDMMQEYVYA